MLDLLCTGTAIVDSIIRGLDPVPVSKTGYRAESGSLQVGGEAVNEATAAAKLGLKTGILCFVGEDIAGRMILDCLRENGVDTQGVERLRDHPTPISTLLVNMDGSRRSITNGAHRYHFHPEEKVALLSSAKAVTLGSLFRAPYDNPEQVYRTVMGAGKALILADTKLPNFAKTTLSDLADSLPRIDYIFPNEDEARYHTGKDNPDDMADVLLGLGVKNVVIKLGAEGCFFKNETERYRLNAFPIEAVDATGAGDTFLAGFAAALLEGKNHEESLRFANACGAICTTAIGATTALKNREQVISLLS